VSPYLTKEPTFPRHQVSLETSRPTRERRNDLDEDLSIIQRVLSGEKDLFGSLVTRHQDRVYRVCLGVLGDPQEAQEASQDAFVRAYKALASFRGDSAFSTWLTRIAINASRTRLRHLRLRSFFSLDALREKGSFAEPVAPPDNPLSGAQALLSALPASDREILLLKEVEGLDYVEISKVLGVSVEGVRGRLKRARARLRHETTGTGV